MSEEVEMDACGHNLVIQSLRQQIERLTAEREEQKNIMYDDRAVLLDMATKLDQGEQTIAELQATLARVEGERERYKHLALVNDACEKEVTAESSKADLYEHCLFLMKRLAQAEQERNRLLSELRGIMEDERHISTDDAIWKFIHRYGL